MLIHHISPSVRADLESRGLWANRSLSGSVDDVAATVPTKVAVADAQRSLTYAELQNASRSLALRLLDLGVEPDDAVAVQAPNSVLLAVAHLAVNRVQGIYVPIHEAWREREVDHLLRRSRAKVVISIDKYKGFDHVEMLQRLQPGLPDLRELIVVEWSAATSAGLWQSKEVAPDEYRRLEAIVADPDAPRHAMISSGTTALPKISGWTDNGLHAAFARAYVDTVGLTADDVVIGIATASTGATGYVFGVLAPLYVGATSILVEPWDPELAISMIERHRGTVAVAVPAQIMKMLESASSATADLAALRALSNGGAPLPEWRARQAEATFGCRVHTMYGSTDAGVPTMMCLTDPEHLRVTTVGRVVDGIELLVVDDDGRPLVGVPGEVRWRGAHKVHGYLNDDDATRAAFDADGWYHSGDLGTLDDAGYLRIVGRKKDMILRGGQNIFPGEIEELLARHPAVAAVAVAGIPDPILGERTCAFVVPAAGRPPMTLELMVEYLSSEGLAKFKWPERLVLLDDLPMTAGGKVLKSALVADVVHDR